MPGMTDILPPLPDGVVYEKADASGAFRPEVYRDKSVRMVLKTAVAAYERSGDYRPHMAVLEGREPTPPTFTADEWIKARPGPCFGAYPRMKPWLNVAWPAEYDRTTPAFFAGNVQPYPSTLERHRWAMIDVPGARVEIGRPLGKIAYQTAMTQSKVALCPWGNGEWSYRVVEAWHAGCVPVMPRSDWVDLWFGPLTAWQHYVPCKPDGSDVAQVCREVCEQWSKYEAMREVSRERARSLLDPVTMLRWVQGVLDAE